MMDNLALLGEICILLVEVVQEESIQVDDQVWQGFASMTSASTGDVDNDGDLDLLIAGSTISGLLNDNGTFEISSEQ